MGWFVFAIILLIIAIILFAIGSRAMKTHQRLVNDPDALRKSDFDSADGPRYAGYVLRGIGVVLTLVALLFGWFSVTFTQDAGDANVLKDITGNVVGSETASGLHFKAPWVDTVTYSIRQQPVVFGNSNDNSSNHTGGSVLGKYVSTNDKSGVQAKVSVALRYSIDPRSVVSIYKQFKTEDNFKTAFITQDVRSAVRDTPNDFTTIQVLTSRAKLQNAMQDEIEKHWRGTGVTIDSISIQEIDYPDAVTTAYSDAVKSQIKVTQAQNNLAAAKIDAQQTIAKADAQAQANERLNQSLTPQILQQQYIDALKASGTKWVVPQGTPPLLSVGQ